MNKGFVLERQTDIETDRERRFMCMSERYRQTVSDKPCSDRQTKIGRQTEKEQGTEMKTEKPRKGRQTDRHTESNTATDSSGRQIQRWT